MMRSQLVKSCSRCGAPFVCGPGESGKCWCEDQPPTAPLGDADCLCARCLSLRAQPRPARLVEGEDYYFEGAAVVFTAAYLKKRGTCCKSGCRHCPY